MPPNIRQFALVIGVEKEVCQLIYEYDLSALQLRPAFEGAQAGKWYRFDLKKGGERIWEQVEDRMPTRQENGAIQICLPICFAPDFTCFGCKNTVTHTSGFDVFYSPFLERGGKINNESVRSWAMKELNAGEQLHVFLTISIKQRNGEGLTPPQWTIESQKDFVTHNDDLSNGDLNYARLGIGTGPRLASKQWGVILKTIDDPKNRNIRMATILSLRDGRLAFGRILRLNGFWRANIGDTVSFIAIEIGCQTKPLRMALNVLAWNTLPIDYNAFVDQFPQDAPPKLPSIRLLHSPEGQQEFELSFPLNEAMLNPHMGTCTIDRLGTIFDSDGKLQKALYGVEQLEKLTGRVRAKFILHEQTALWMLAEVSEVARIEQKNGGQTPNSGGSGRSSRAEDERGGERRQPSSGRNSPLPAHRPLFNAQPSLITTRPEREGGFGSMKAERWQQKQKNYPGTGSNSIPLGNPNGHTSSSNSILIDNAMGELSKAFAATPTKQSVAQQQQQKQRVASLSSEREGGGEEQFSGIVLYLRAKGDELNLLFYNEQTNRLERPCYTKKQKVPFPAGSDPLPGNFYQIVYKKQRTENTIGILSIRDADPALVPIKQVNPHNQDLWTKLLDGRHAEIRLANEQDQNGKELQQQRAKAQRNPPVPVCTVFSRASGPKTTTAPNSGMATNKVQVPEGAQKEKAQSNKVDNNECPIPPLLRCNSTFFFVGNQMAGIVVNACKLPDTPKYSYQIWPFCTGRTIPRELTLQTSRRLPLGHWLKFSIHDYANKVIREDYAHGLAPWITTRTRATGTIVCLECDVSVPKDFGSNSFAELCTAKFKPANPGTPFIRKLIPLDQFLPRLTSHWRGTVCKALLEYESETDEEGTARGYWRIVEMK